MNLTLPHVNEVNIKSEGRGFGHVEFEPSYRQRVKAVEAGFVESRRDVAEALIGELVLRVTLVVGSLFTLPVKKTPV